MERELIVNLSKFQAIITYRSKKSNVLYNLNKVTDSVMLVFFNYFNVLFGATMLHYWRKSDRTSIAQQKHVVNEIYHSPVHIFCTQNNILCPFMGEFSTLDLQP